MKKDLILSLAVDGRDKYSEVVRGLEKSIVDANWEGDVRIYKEWPDWVTPNSEIPYKFKYDLIVAAKKEDYKRIFWLDSTMRVIPGKDISTLLDASEKGVVAFENLGHPLKAYINDTAIHLLSIDSLDSTAQCWGGCVFWDFTKWEAFILFEQLWRRMMEGCFKEDNTKREGFIAHRHDQAVLSWLLHKYNYPLLPYGIIAAAKDVTDQTYIQYGD